MRSVGSVGSVISARIDTLNIFREKDDHEKMECSAKKW